MDTQTQLNFHLVSLSSDICYDDFDLGEGPSTGCGLQGERLGLTFETLPALIKFLADIYGLPADAADYDIERDSIRCSKTVADHSDAQNGGWFDPTEEEIDRWKQGQQTLYVEHFQARFVRCLPAGAVAH